MIPSEGSDWGPVGGGGGEHPPPVTHAGLAALTPGTNPAEEARALFAASTGSVIPSCLKANHVASLRNYLLATSIPVWSSKENLREIVRVFRSPFWTTLTFIHYKFFEQSSFSMGVFFPPK